jgi:hypothetical protein
MDVETVVHPIHPRSIAMDAGTCWLPLETGFWNGPPVRDSPTKISSKQAQRSPDGSCAGDTQLASSAPVLPPWPAVCELQPRSPCTISACVFGAVLLVFMRLTYSLKMRLE